MQDNAFQGSLFSSDFLQESIARLPDWAGLSDQDIATLATDLRQIFDRFPFTQTPNESQTEDDLIWPILQRLGWSHSLRQQNLAARGRDDVPDGLLFKDDVAKAQANGFPEEWRRYECGLAIVESKRWARPLDRRSGKKGEETAPSTQMLRYLRRVDDMTTGKLRWGILTNGAKWRLYYQGARSVSEQFFEVDLATILDLPGHNDGLFALSPEERAHILRVFTLIFRREAFLPTSSDNRTFHQRALQEGQFYEEKVANNLSNVVFGRVFPDLARAVAGAAPNAPLQEVREATLILLYRLLFILYAEDRDLLPVRDPRYDDYGLREKVRGDVGRRKDQNDTFSETAARYWSVLDDLCRALDQGDASIGLPPYNGGLFSRQQTPLLSDIRLGDAVMASVIDALSFEQTPDGRKYINYRNMSVQQLGSIYERLLEHEIVADEQQGVIVRPNIFARKGSGSYYTPDDLVGLIIRETVGPLVSARMEAFTAKAAEIATSNQPEDRRIGMLQRLDPAEKLLELKICDPAMGSGHFLVTLVDYLSDQVIAAMAEAENLVEWGEYISPLANRIETIRNTILNNAEERGWTIDIEQLDDRHIIRRMVLKRCVYGVDKNPMAVELAKVALWLHTFTVGAPLSFLDHHLRCGDSLFGNWVKKGIDKAVSYGSPLLLHSSITRAMGSAASMQTIEGLTDAEIAEAHRSADIFAGIRDMTADLDAFLSLQHALDWVIKDRGDKDAIRVFFDGQFGDPIQVARGAELAEVARTAKIATADGGARSRAQQTAEAAAGRVERARNLVLEARGLAEEERFFNWQVMFPGVWSDWQQDDLRGGFDAVIGNPPWDVYEFEDVAWFAARDREIALLTSEEGRKKAIRKLQNDVSPLWQEYMSATNRLLLGTKLLRSDDGDYKLLNSGKLNLYKLFVERAMMIVKSSGMVGLLTPSGIASDKTSAPFFKEVATDNRLKAFYDFENKKSFFPDVHASFKFCIFIASPSSMDQPASCAFYLHTVAELEDQERRFTLSAEDFSRVNPNTGTAPIFRNRKDANLTTEIYKRLPIMVDRSTGNINRVWDVQFDQMLNMTTDSNLFFSKMDLEEREGAYLIDNNRYRNEEVSWLPLYEGKMVQAFDHRAADIIVNDQNVFRAGQQDALSNDDKRNPDRFPQPRYYVQYSDTWWKNAPYEWVIAFKDITATTNIRTMIAALIPLCGAGHTLPVLNFTNAQNAAAKACLLLGNLNALVFDFVARQKVQSTHFSNYILEQIPVVPENIFNETSFGNLKAAQIVQQAVLELTYTANDMASFAIDLGYVDEQGAVRPPFVWDEERRLRLRAKLDAVYFHLYGITDRDDVRYIYSTFKIIERQENAAHGRYLSRDLCLAYMSALAAGDPDAEIRL